MGLVCLYRVPASIHQCIMNTCMHNYTKTWLYTDDKKYFIIEMFVPLFPVATVTKTYFWLNNKVLPEGLLL